LRRHVLAEIRRELLPSPTIANGDRDRPLGRILADDVFVELGDDLTRREVLHRGRLRCLSLAEGRVFSPQSHREHRASPRGVTALKDRVRKQGRGGRQEENKTRPLLSAPVTFLNSSSSCLPYSAFDEHHAARQCSVLSVTLWFRFRSLLHRFHFQVPVRVD